MLSQTLVAPAEWVFEQDYSKWLKPHEMALCSASPSLRRRADRIAGRLALKKLLRESFEISPLTYEIGSDGPAPALIDWLGPPGLTVSLSHSMGTGAASWAWGVAQGIVGIDIQHIRSVHIGLSARVLAETERHQQGDILLFWALKEAAIKARRQPWGRAMNEIIVTFLEAGTARIDIVREPPLMASYRQQEDWWLARVIKLNASDQDAE
jgi:4'-phosphopantetheinyl transferase EntD